MRERERENCHELWPLLDEYAVSTYAWALANKTKKKKMFIEFAFHFQFFRVAYTKLHPTRTFNNIYFRVTS